MAITDKSKTSKMQRQPTEWVKFVTKYWNDNKSKYATFKDMLKDKNLKLEYQKSKK